MERRQAGKEEEIEPIKPTLTKEEAKRKLKELSENRATTLKYQLKIQQRALSSSGILSLKMVKHLTTLEGVGVQSHMSILDISETDVVSMETLAPQQKLTQILADNSELSQYTGLSKFPNITNFSAVSAPISNREMFRIALLIVIGPKLTVINGKKVKRNELEIASSYPKLARLLVEAGWDPSTEDLKEKHYRQLAMDYGISVDGIDDWMKDDITSWMAPVFRCLATPEDEKKMLETSRTMDQYEKEYLEDLLAMELAAEMRKYGISVAKGENMKEEILVAVQQLADLVKTLDNCSDDILGRDEEEEEEEDVQD